jgi:hypothetical protein
MIEIEDAHGKAPQGRAELCVMLREKTKAPPDFSGGAFMCDGGACAWVTRKSKNLRFRADRSVSFCP